MRGDGGLGVVDLWLHLGQGCRFLRRVVFGGGNGGWVGGCGEFEVSGLEFVRVVSWRCWSFG